ncbi:hypothetical protein M3M38_07340 [Fructilactobacillus cliffordii]|uniref:hypothetical protein n=1 Tax=Fructilactobacillus cliffordii TaxID=2940299 RepID=UPI002092A92F|nr:hypothetical protein [Fructilactobacillus cliffordii]USS86473.1 hypothetical protein M3M38_07340 [Fructilactobacillus cliffordii]
MIEKKIEVPVVSLELVRAFHQGLSSSSFSKTDILNPKLYIYKKTPEMKKYGSDYLAVLLAKMITVGCEVERIKKYAIQLPDKDRGGGIWYLIRNWLGGWDLTCNIEEASMTMKEIEDDPGLREFKQFAVEVDDNNG